MTRRRRDLAALMTLFIVSLPATASGQGIPTTATFDALEPRNIGPATAGSSWILDDINALQEVSDEILAQAAHLFSTQPARQIRYRPQGGHTGAERALWTEVQMAMATFLVRVSERVEEVDGWADRIEAEEVDLEAALRTKVLDLNRELGELRSRISRLMNGVSGEVGPLSEQEGQQWTFVREMAETLSREWSAVAEGLPSGES